MNQENNIVKFENLEMAEERIGRNLKEWKSEISKNAEERLKAPDMMGRLKLENLMMKAIGDGDDVEFERIVELMKEMDKRGLSVIKGGQE